MLMTYSVNHRFFDGGFLKKKGRDIIRVTIYYIRHLSNTCKCVVLFSIL